LGELDALFEGFHGAFEIFGAGHGGVLWREFFFVL
jgi:hypothetical protein